MNVQQILETIAERVATSASVGNVFGDPVVAGNRTVIPVATVRYAFGGGAGGTRENDAPGGGGGGRVSARPYGALEITTEGARFVRADRLPAAAALAIGFLLGAAAMALARPRRVEVVKRPE